MAIVLDADVIIQGERKAFDLKGWVASQPDEQFAVAAITVGELWHGVVRATGKCRTERETYVRRILSSVRVLSYLESTALEHARFGPNWSRLAK